MELTKDRYIASVKRFLGSADPEKLVDLLGEDVAAKLGATKKKAPAKPKQAIQTDADHGYKPPKS